MSQRAVSPALPAGTLALVAFGAACELAPALAGALGWERAAIERGEAWRVLTGHLVHGSPALAFVDLAALLLLGSWLELRSRARFATVLLASALAASVALLAATPLARYSGSSALSSGLFVAAACELLRSRRRATRWLGVAALVAFAAKIALEFAGNTAGLVELPPGTTVAVAAHLAGGVGGGLGALAAAWLQARKARTMKRPAELSAAQTAARERLHGAS